MIALPVRRPWGLLGRLIEWLVPRTRSREEQRFMNLSWLALVEQAAEDVMDEHHPSDATVSGYGPWCRCGEAVRSWRTHWGREIGRRVAADRRAGPALVAYQGGLKS